MGMEEEDDKKPKPGESGVSIWLRFFDETIKIIKHKGIKIQNISNFLFFKISFIFHFPQKSVYSHQLVLFISYQYYFLKS